MREKAHIIKAINALKSAGSGEPIDRIPYLTEDMAERLVDMGYAEKSTWERNPAIFCYGVSAAGWQALKEKPEPKRKIAMLQPRISALPPRIKPFNGR